MRKIVLALLAISLLSVTPSSLAAKVTPGTSCKKAGAQVRYSGKLYTCIKLGKKLYWDNGKGISSLPKQAIPTQSPTPTPTPTPSDTEKLIISPVPFGYFNTTFMLGKPQSRDIGQSIFIESDEVLNRLDFQIVMFTLISPEYHSATEEQKHGFEKAAFKGDYRPTPAKINVSIWKDDKGVLSGLPATFDLKNGFSQIKEFEVTQTISLGETTRIHFPEQVTVTPGYYYINLYFLLDDLNITTLRFAGRQTGNNTMGGPNRDMPTNCKYTPATDLYPRGQAYYSYQDNNWENKTPDEKWNYQTPRSYTFKLHDYAKVSECVVIGNYNDILNTGDIFFDIFAKPK